METSLGVRDGDGDADDDDDARARVRLPAVHASLHCFAELTGLAPSLTAQAGRQAGQASSLCCCLLLLIYSVFLAILLPSGLSLPFSRFPVPPQPPSFPRTHNAATVRKDALLTLLGSIFSRNLLIYLR